MIIMIFQPAARFPADPRAVFILAFSVFTGIITLALDAQPGTLEAVMPHWGVVVWGAILIGGSATALIGMWLQTINGIIIEQIGSVAVCVATAFYAIMLIWLAGERAYMSAGIILAWGIACGLRWVQLQILIDTAYREKLIDTAKEEFKQEIFGEALENDGDADHDH